MRGTHLPRFLAVIFFYPTVLWAQQAALPTGDLLPGTARLELTEPLDVVMVRGISRFAERELAKSRARRDAAWLSGDQVEESTDEARHRLRQIIGAVDPLDDSARLWSTLLNESAGQSSGSEPQTQLEMVRWSVTEGISGEALRLHRRSNDPSESRPLAIVILDPAENVLEQLRYFELSGFDAICPILVDRDTYLSGHPAIRQTNMTHREYIYRVGFNLGRHVIGYEVERVLTLIHKISSANRPLVIVGSGEGAVIAQYVSALAPNHVDATVLHGYFGPREDVWKDPIYRNVWSQLTEFGDAEIASLIAPRTLIIEAGNAPAVEGPPVPQAGQAPYAAPGSIESPTLEEVRKEFNRAQDYFSRTGQPDRIHLVTTPDRLCHSQSLAILKKSLDIQLESSSLPKPDDGLNSLPDEESSKAQQTRLTEELVRHTQMLLARADKVRAELWKNVDRSSVNAWEKQAPDYREIVHNTFIGKLNISPADPQPRSRKVIDEPTHVGYEVTLNVTPSEKWSEADPGIIAGGIILLPKDLKEGERRPVVVCQHGLEGVPMDTITLDQSQRAYRAYKGYSTQLVRRGFIVYAPQNPYRGKDDFRVLQRKSNPLGRSLFSYIIEQHRQTLKWLGSLPYVDADRIAFYGLSYGGKTAVRVPPLLPARDSETLPGYCLSICSADFNEWIRKNASAEDRYSYVYTPEYEIFEWNMGHIANYAELSWLMAPRPFMVERGHDDGVAPDEWVGWEFAKVRRHYTKLGISARTEIEWFDGPHSINGEGTFRFLHKHLNWPEPSETTQQ